VCSFSQQGDLPILAWLKEREREKKRVIGERERKEGRRNINGRW
jgi:hypothetical protein